MLIGTISSRFSNLSTAINNKTGDTMCNETCTDGDKSITRDPDSALKLIKEPDRIWLPRRNESGGMIDICRFLSPSPPCFPLSTSISDRRDHRVRLTVIYHVIPVRAIRPQRSGVRVHVRTGETCSSDLRAARKLIGPRIDACSPAEPPHRLVLLVLFQIFVAVVD